MNHYVEGKILKPDGIIEFRNRSRLDETTADPEGQHPSSTLEVLLISDRWCLSLPGINQSLACELYLRAPACPGYVSNSNIGSFWFHRVSMFQKCSDPLWATNYSKGIRVPILIQELGSSHKM